MNVCKVLHQNKTYKSMKGTDSRSQLLGDRVSAVSAPRADWQAWPQLV